MRPPKWSGDFWYDLWVRPQLDFIEISFVTTGVSVVVVVDDFMCNENPSCWRLISDFLGKALVIASFGGEYIVFASAVYNV